MIVSRFAPAPTGFLHLGHVVNALHVWGITRALGGRVLLRIENHDAQRSRAEYERAILDDLDWLGCVPDEPSTDAFRAGTCRGRQSDRHDIYGSALATLLDAGRPAALQIQSGCSADLQVRRDDGADSGCSADLQVRPGAPLVYACDCTRRDIRDAMERTDGPLPPDTELRYSGRCRTRALTWRPGLGLRLRLDDTVETFDDLRHGVQTQQPSQQCGDLLVKDRDGNWTYQFAVVVDDMVQGVNLVVRGDDLLASTGRQIQLARLLGRAEPPRFLHHGLIMKSATQKLSKADHDTSVRDMRASGASAEDVFGRAAYAAGFAPAPTPLSREAAQALVVARYAERLALVQRGLRVSAASVVPREGA